MRQSGPEPVILQMRLVLQRLAPSRGVFQHTPAVAPIGGDVTINACQRHFCDEWRCLLWGKSLAKEPAQRCRQADEAQLRAGFANTVAAAASIFISQSGDAKDLLFP